MRKVPYVKLVFFTDERGKQDLMVGAQNGLKQKWKRSCKKETKNKYICPHLDN